MTDAVPTQARQLFSTVNEDGTLDLSIRDVPVPVPTGDQVLVRVGATPINPSDLAVLLSVADPNAFASVDGVARAPIPEALRRFSAPRVGKSIQVGNEGAGTVVAAGDDPAAQALIGKTVGSWGGAFYAQYRLLRASDCLVLPDGVSAEEGASSFINPMTVLAMLFTMRREGFGGIVHTAAASNLGQMLVKHTSDEGVPLVNIVRSAAQAALLRELGATHIVDSSADDFMPRLIEAIAETQAFLAFDAIGGGKLANQILTAMEAAAIRTDPATGPYGSNTRKQVYIYGGLNTAPTEITRTFGMQWGVGGWLVTPQLHIAGAETVAAMRAKVAAEIRTTFASAYTARITLDEAIKPDVIAAYNRRATGEKYLIVPNG